MAGIYVHIPFCKKRCLYCDFFSTTLLDRRKEYIDALIKELRSDRIRELESIKTIYLGGGTPSTLEANDIKRIIDTIGSQGVEEITMELNPGDADIEYLKAIRQAGINRLSIGIQSFDDSLLRLIGRRHNAKQAVEAVKIAKEAGFDNISIDLMYALPTQTMEQWERTIDEALSLNVQHISSYGLMYENGTAMTQMMEQGQIETIDEDTENEMYDYLCERLKQVGFIHYEVSNFALQGYESKHNSAYWNNTPYLGIGAGSHSYVPPVRSWNPSNLDTYINGINDGTLIRESETLSEKDIYNERIMLGLRVNRGIPDSFPIHSQGQMERYIRQGLLCKTDDNRIVATQKGIHILNRIIEDLMI